MTFRIGILLGGQMVVPLAMMWSSRMVLNLVSDLLNLRSILVGTYVGSLQLRGVV